jgi:hypothetical protein
MSLMDVLQQYVNPTPAPIEQAETHFQEVARAAPPDLVGQGIAGALRSDQTPPFNEMVAQLFGHSNPQQRAGLLNELLRAVGPGLLSGVAGGGLGRILQNAQGSANAGLPTVTPTQASQVTPQEVSEVAARAESKDPTIIDRVGGFYAEHPQVVKALGGIALAIALGRMANARR